MPGARDIRGWLVDLDGTLICGGRAIAGAAAFLRIWQGRFAVVSNDAEHTPAELARALRQMGLDIPAERLILAGAAAIDEIATRRPGSRILALISPSLARYAREKGLRLVRTRPDIVLLGRDRRFHYARLMTAANALRAGAELVVCNADLVHPGPNATVVPETGALLAALLACTGPRPYRLIGKPEPALFAAGLALLDLPKAAVAMLGDNPLTDGEGARRFGLRYVAITSGRFPEIAGETACPTPADMYALPA